MLIIKGNNWLSFYRFGTGFHFVIHLIIFGKKLYKQYSLFVKSNPIKFKGE